MARVPRAIRSSLVTGFVLGKWPFKRARTALPPLRTVLDQGGRARADAPPPVASRGAVSLFGARSPRRREGLGPRIEEGRHGK